jgi:hypothetical protein
MDRAAPATRSHLRFGRKTAAPARRSRWPAGSPTPDCGISRNAAPRPTDVSSMRQPACRWKLGFFRNHGISPACSGQKAWVGPAALVRMAAGPAGAGGALAAPTSHLRQGARSVPPSHRWGMDDRKSPACPGILRRVQATCSITTAARRPLSESGRAIGQL